MSSSPAHQLPSTLWRRRRRKRRSGEQAAPVDPPKPPRNPPETPTVGTACSLAIATRERSGMADLDRHVGVASERKTEIGRIGEGVAWVSLPPATCFSSSPTPQVSPLPTCRTESDSGTEAKERLVSNSPVSNRGTADPQRLLEGSRVPFVRLERLRMPPASGRLLVSQISAEQRRHNGPHQDPDLPPEGAVSPEPARSCTSQAHRRKITIATPVPVSLPFVSLRRIQQGDLSEGQTAKLGQPPPGAKSTGQHPPSPSHNPSGVTQDHSRNPSMSPTSAEPEPDSDPTPESESKPDVEFKPDLEFKPYLEAELDLKSEPHLEWKPHLDLDLDLKHHLESDSRLHSEPQPETDSQPESEQQPESKWFLGSGPDIKREPESQPEADSELDPESAPQPASEPHPESELDPGLEPDLDPESDQDPGPLVARVGMSRPCTHPEWLQGEGPREEGAVQMENEDFCAVCLNGGDLLCCDRCPKVFHLSCHIPALLSFPEGDWLCTLCRDILQPELEYDCENTRLSGDHVPKRVSYGLSPCDQRRCEKLTLLVSCNILSAPFHEPVSPLARHYYQIIKRPMDLSAIRSKLNKRHPLHYCTPEDYVADVCLMFRNCATFNYPDSEVAQAGRSLKAFFQSKLREVFPGKTFHLGSDSDSDSDDYMTIYRAGVDDFPWSTRKEHCDRKRKKRRSLN